MSSSTVNRYGESGAAATSTEVYNQHNNSFPEEHAFHAMAKETKVRRQQEHEQIRVARQIRYKELKKTVQDNDDDNEPSPPPIGSNKSSANSLLLQKFLNGDTDIGLIEQRDLKRLLSELESKYKSVMITNSIIYNEKQTLHYQIDTYKDALDEHYETLHQVKRQYKEKCTDFDFQKHTLIDLQKDNNQLREVLVNCQNLIEESEKQRCTSDLNASIDEQLKRILDEKQQQLEQIAKLKSEFDEEKKRSKLLEKQKPNAVDLPNQNINDLCNFEQQKQLMRQITDLRNRLQQVEADNGSLQQENKRYEAQLTRYKQQLDDAEHAEEELKQERRRLQRELRVTRDELENEHERCNVLQRENERLRTSLKKNLLQNIDNDLVGSRSQSPLLPINSNDIHSNSPTEDYT